MKILIRYLAMHDDLSEQSKALWDGFASKHNIDVEFVPVKDFAYLAQYNTFATPAHKADIVIQLDEDCFITRPQSLIDMAEYMWEHGVAYCGMREIDSTIRQNVQGIKDYYINSFFMMVQPSCIGELPSAFELLDFEKKEEGVWLEPYWNIIGYMKQRGFKFKSLIPKPHYDSISTILHDFAGNPFCIHTWFARLWDCNVETEEQEGVPCNRQRIEDALAYARKQCQSK